MSQETMTWLNTMTLIGMTDKRGNAWHYRAEDQGNESNHYTGAIPVADVKRRLFNFTVEERPLITLIACDADVADMIGADGMPYRYVAIADRKAMVTSDDDTVLGIFKSGYQGHDYNEWLIENVESILDADLSIGSAGLLKNRAQAWVSIEVEDTIETPSGLSFRPHLLAYTSFDGSLATGYKRCVQFTVCDNTFEVARSERGQSMKVKHSKYSKLKLADAREALEVVHGISDDFMVELDRLVCEEVSDKQFAKVLDIVVPLPEDGNKRGTTVAQDKRNTIHSLYTHDDRSATWNGTKFGVVQAFNTYGHHYAGIRSTNGAEANRAQRNMENVLSGKLAASDTMVIEALDLVCAN